MDLLTATTISLDQALAQRDEAWRQLAELLGAVAIATGEPLSTAPTPEAVTAAIAQLQTMEPVPMREPVSLRGWEPA